MKFVTSLVLLAATSVVANSRELEGTTARKLQIFDVFLGGFGMDLFRWNVTQVSAQMKPFAIFFSWT